MFQTITIISFVIVLGGIAIHFVTLPSGSASAMAVACRREIFGFWNLSNQDVTLFGRLKRLAVFVAFACLVVLTLTGFIPPVFFGHLLSGYALILHASAAPVFMVCVAFIAVVWAYSCRFKRRDWDAFCGLPESPGASPPSHGGLAWKLSFWIAIALAIPVSLSILLGMYPIFGTHDQELLLGLHRYTSLALVLAAITHLYLVLHARSASNEAAKPVRAPGRIDQTAPGAGVHADINSDINPTHSAASRSKSRVGATGVAGQGSSGDENIGDPNSTPPSATASAVSSGSATGRKRVGPKAGGGKKKASSATGKGAGKARSRTRTKKPADGAA